MNTTTLFLGVIVLAAGVALAAGGKGSAAHDEDLGFAWMPECGGLVLTDAAKALRSAHAIGGSMPWAFAKQRIFSETCPRDQAVAALAPNPVIARLFYEIVRAAMQGQAKRYPKADPAKALRPLLLEWRTAFKKAGVEVADWPVEIGKWAGGALP